MQWEDDVHIVASIKGRDADDILLRASDGSRMRRRFGENTWKRWKAANKEWDEKMGFMFKAILEETPYDTGSLKGTAQLIKGDKDSTINRYTDIGGSGKGSVKDFDGTIEHRIAYGGPIVEPRWLNLKKEPNNPVTYVEAIRAWEAGYYGNDWINRVINRSEDWLMFEFNKLGIEFLKW